MKTETRTDEDRVRLNTSIISLFVAIILFMIKFYAFRLTNSQSILSDALENIINIVTAIAALSVIMISAKPADKDHPYGHGKAEYFASAFEGGAIIFAGILIIFQGVESLIYMRTLHDLNTGMILVTIAGLCNGFLGLYLKYVGKKHLSPALVSSGHHVMSDCLTSIGVIVGLILVKLTGSFWPDSIAAITLGVVLTYQGFKIIKESGSELMDAENMSVINELAQLLEKKRFSGIINFHYMRVMRAGRFHHVNIHIEVPEYWTVKEAHDQSEKFEDLVMKDYTFDGEIHFHLDPCKKKYCKQCDINNCPIRTDIFEGLKPIDIEVLISPDK